MPTQAQFQIAAVQHMSVATVTGVAQRVLEQGQQHLARQPMREQACDMSG